MYAEDITETNVASLIATSCPNEPCLVSSVCYVPLMSLNVFGFYKSSHGTFAFCAMFVFSMGLSKILFANILCCMSAASKSH